MVPADEYAEASQRRVDWLESEVARREIEFLVICRVIRNVHLAVDARTASVAVENHGGVVVKTGSATLENRSDDDHSEFAGESRVRFGNFRVDADGEVEIVGILRLAEVERIVEFLVDDELRPVGGQMVNLLLNPTTVVGDVGRVMLLNYTCFHICVISCIVEQ